ncbi:MAG: heavy-metal-associated domain-containing protein [Oscillospiraceae bacterium]|nr:heavy-metal-associated domain-containing protein [Oscillospiraceae bacterium]
MEQKSFTVNGMGCANCAAKVRAALEAVPGVAKAEVDHAAKKAVVTLAEGAAVADETLKAAVNALGRYTAE